ncbi:cold-shock protein [Wolbachia endosymbiont of Ctenocephalides felis wCfeT]|uniref:cold-shock protein n=1 Tax=Wolbachia endosymbiont of Ctenocephalides felis wCfeT TaxID=2732593 RepID=UPI00144670D1|nr:cold shock domain-containing protein [Wolbachia endosymbiont of Ctenocephalides felis wCfeT]
MTSDNKEFGHIKWFNSDKGYGFIKPDNKGSDIFVHITELSHAGIKPDSLKGENKEKGIKGERVSYKLKEERGRNGEEKKSAIKLELIEEVG